MYRSLNITKFGFTFKRRFSDLKNFYTKNHEWIKVIENSTKGNNILKAKIGITDYSQRALGDIVFIEMPKVETRYNADGKLNARAN